MAEAVGAFMVCAVLITLAGVTRWFERVMNRIPMEIAAALLAGVLARFGMQAFAAAQTALPLVLLMLGAIWWHAGGCRAMPWSSRWRWRCICRAAWGRWPGRP
jgi:predicted benzoate:H+ symporter BenE